MRSRIAIVVIVGVVSFAAQAAPTPWDVRMNAYLGIWSRNADITAATVESLYARRVDYYGRPMSVAAVYRDKLAFIRRWPLRRYAVVPGSVTNDCGDGTHRCSVSAVLRWSRADRTGRPQSGINSVRLDLARENGTLKIVRESGSPIGRR